MRRKRYPGLASVFAQSLSKIAEITLHSSRTPPPEPVGLPKLTEDNPDYWLPPSTPGQEDLPGSDTWKYRSKPYSRVRPDEDMAWVRKDRAQLDDIIKSLPPDRPRGAVVATITDFNNALAGRLAPASSGIFSKKWKPFAADSTTTSKPEAIAVTAKPVQKSPGQGLPTEWAKGKTRYSKAVKPGTQPREFRFQPRREEVVTPAVIEPPTTDETPVTVAGPATGKIDALTNRITDWVIAHPDETKATGIGIAALAGAGLGAYGLHKLYKYMKRDDAKKRGTKKAAVNDVTQTQFNLGSLSRDMRYTGMRPPADQHPMAALYKANDPAKDPAKFIAAGKAMQDKYYGPGNALDRKANPVSGNARHLGNEVSTVAGGLWDDIKNKYTKDIEPWFQDPKNIDRLKTWGIPIATALGSMGLYSLLSPKDRNESGWGRAARLGLAGAAGAGLGYAANKYGPNLYQQGKTLLQDWSKQSESVWDELDNPSQCYLTGFVKACRVKRIDPVTFIPVDLVKAAEAR